MKKNNLRTKNIKGKIIILLLLLVITVGYAVLQSSITINGTSRITDARWDIHFDNVSVTPGSVEIGEGDSAASITISDNTKVTYAVTLDKPGDFYEFTFDAINGGTIDGMVSVVTTTLKVGDGEAVVIGDNNENLPSYLNYSVTYSDGSEIKRNHEIKAGEVESYKVRIEFNKDISNDQLPSAEQDLTMVLDVGYNQADSNAKKRPPYYSCTYDGELVQGAEYVNGQYTYRYMQQRTWRSGDGYIWEDISDDGWGVILTDVNSTDPVTTALCSSINNKPIVSMQHTFHNSKASSIDLSSFNTSNVKSMQSMFSSSSAKNLNVETFDTSNVTNMEFMFSYTGDASYSLDLRSFDTSNVTTMYDMFSSSKYKSIDTSSFNTSKVLDFGYMFSYCSNIKELDLSNFDVSNANYIVSILTNLSSIEKINISNWDLSWFDTGGVGMMAVLMSHVNHGLKEIIMDNFVFPEYSGYFFYNLQDVDDFKLSLKNVDTSKVTNMYNMFYNLKIKELDLSDFDTSNVTDMSFMFASMSNIKTLDLSNFDTRKVNTMNGMFSYSSKLEIVNLSSFVTSQGPSMTTMFDNTTNLNKIDLSSFDMTNVASDKTAKMFRNTGATIGYAKTQADADILNASSNKPGTLTFVPKP